MTKTLDIAGLVAKAIGGNLPPAGSPDSRLSPAVITLPGTRQGPTGSSQGAEPPQTTTLALGTRLQILHADQLESLPPLAWLIPGEIPARSLTVLYGPSGTGKSFVALDYAFRIAQTAPVLYVAAEGVYGFAARKLAWCRLNKLPAGQAWFLPQAIDLLGNLAALDLIHTAAPLQPALIVVDTLARCMSGDENSSRDMGQFIAACDGIRAATGATVLLIHHTGKSGLSERGSSALRAAADQMLELSNDDGLITLCCAKSKDAEAFKPRCYRLVTTETGRTAPDDQPETSCAIMPANRVYIAANQVSAAGRQLLETLALETFANSGARTIALRDASNLRPATLFRVLSSLLRAGLIRQTKRGDPYFITDLGRETLTTLMDVS
jgi:hypothetical protein